MVAPAPAPAPAPAAPAPAPAPAPGPAPGKGCAWVLGSQGLSCTKACSTRSFTATSRVPSGTLGACVSSAWDNLQCDTCVGPTTPPSYFKSTVMYSSGNTCSGSFSGMPYAASPLQCTGSSCANPKMCFWKPYTPTQRAALTSVGVCDTVPEVTPGASAGAISSRFCCCACGSGTYSDDEKGCTRCVMSPPCVSNSNFVLF